MEKTIKKHNFVIMGNLRQKYTDEEWEELQEEIRREKENKIKNLRLIQKKANVFQPLDEFC